MLRLATELLCLAWAKLLSPSSLEGLCYWLPCQPIGETDFVKPWAELFLDSWLLPFPFQVHVMMVTLGVFEWVAQPVETHGYLPCGPGSLHGDLAHVCVHRTGVRAGS